MFDTHAHLDDNRFKKDLESVIKEAFKDNVEYILNPGADISSSARAVDISNKYENIYSAVGVHPHSAKEMDEDSLELLKHLAKNKNVRAIGEIGLDFHYDNSPRDIQIKWFKRQIELSKELKLPLIIHDRDANQLTFDILNEYNASEYGCVLHCYSGSKDLALEYEKRGYYISIAGPITFKNAKKPFEVAEALDLKTLLIETDSPYLTPHPYRGKRNKPSYVRYVAEEIAKAKGISVIEVINKTKENGKKLFNIK